MSHWKQLKILRKKEIDFKIEAVDGTSASSASSTVASIEAKNYADEWSELVNKYGNILIL